MDVQEQIERGTVWVSPSTVSPPNLPWSTDKVDQIAVSLAQRGWVGRPIVAHEVDGGYQAWTAAHRLAAALKVGLALVPVFLVDMERQRNVMFRHFGIWVGGEQLDDPVAALMLMDEQEPRP